ncbi:hypothetical protein PoB_005775100 [Plakobranchus ocellatus]|uniref:Uncharacterized protein n=1 Tax=Plakobranchus ocellatus TaxID=259542 RepID=A0AAV4CIF6_9GAST|nr:hypothetical protein PoB_005775100 [Plakobranchus ocellatus]
MLDKAKVLLLLTLLCAWHCDLAGADDDDDDDDNPESDGDGEPQISNTVFCTRMCDMGIGGNACDCTRPAFPGR